MGSVQPITAELFQKLLPAYCGGGVPVSEPLACGPMLRDLNTDKTAAAFTQIVNGACTTDFENYLWILSKDGWSVEWQREAAGNRYACCCKNADDQVFRTFLSFAPARERLEIVLDGGSVSESVFNDLPDIDLSRRAEFFLYGLNMDPGGYNPKGKPDSHLNTTGLPNCGMILILRGKDGKLIVIDGGMSAQWKYENAMEQLDEFLHQITGKRRDEVVDISCWYLTHFHSDHVNGFYDLLNEHPGAYRLERVLCNLPPMADYPTCNNMAVLQKLAALIAEKYPDCREVKAHTGNRFTVSGIELEVLYAHEDALDEERRVLKDSNDTTTVVRASADGMSLMVLGDTNRLTEGILVPAYGNALKSDIVQAAHHNFNCLEQIYGFIHAPIAWFTQAEKGITKNEMTMRNSDAVKAHSQKLYFAGNVKCTAGFAMKGGSIQEIYSNRTYLG